MTIMPGFKSVSFVWYPLLRAESEGIKANTSNTVHKAWHRNKRFREVYVVIKLKLSFKYTPSNRDKKREPNFIVSSLTSD